jgi:hypothetical protein
MKVELSTLKKGVEDVLAESPLRTSIGGFRLDEGNDGDGFEFIRVLFDINPVTPVPDADLADLAAHIEDALAQLDERFASVRFSDAA